MQHIKSIHLAVGIFGIIAFVVQGQYMAIFLQGLSDLPDGPRLLYRSSHIYLMWASLLNLAIGFYFAAATTRGARIAQGISSAMLLLGPPLMLLGFALEARLGELARPYCDSANYLALAGVILHVFASRKPRADRV